MMKRPELLLLISLLSSCTGVHPDRPGDAAVHAGWYIEHASGMATFRPCRGQQSWSLQGGGMVRQHAREFELAAETPVYVRLSGHKLPDRAVLVVSDVLQFGAEQPVRDCPMTGVVTSPRGPDGE